MCFAPRALFRHLNFQKWSEHGVFCTFWLWNVLRATTTTACTFSTSQLPKVVRAWCVLYISTSKCASRHDGVHFSTSQLPKVVRTWCVFVHFFLWNVLRGDNGVQFFISHLASWLRTRRFSEPTFRPSAPIIGKTRCFATFLPFRTPGSSFFGDSLFDLLSSSLLWLFPSLLFICPYCRKFDF